MSSALAARTASRSATCAAWRALVTFHVGAGARAAFRAGTVGIAAVLFAFGSTPGDLGHVPRPMFTVQLVARALVGREPAAADGGARLDGILNQGPLGTRYFVAVLAGVLGALAARRVTLGATGWMRSLPASAVTTRRAAWTATTLAALPAAAFPLAAVALAVGVYGLPLAPAKLAGVPLLLAAAGAAATPVARRGTRALAVTAFIGAAWATWPTVVLAAAALAAWDRWAGGLRAPRASRGAAHTSGAGAGTARRRRLPPRAAALAQAAWWAWRAAGWRASVNGAVAAALSVAFAAFTLVNNPDLAPSTRAWVARLGVALGVAVAVACGAAALLARRAPWPWARTLPWSAAERVAVDAFALGIPAAAAGAGAGLVLAVVEGATRPGALAALVGVALVTATVSAVAAPGALRVGAGRQTGAVGEVALVGVPTAVLFALRPALALLAPFAALAFGALAVHRERRAAGAVRWDELRHDVAGDVGWIARV